MRQAVAEAGFAAILLGICALVAVGARDIAPPLYDPLGSAALPLAAACIVAALALAMLARAVRALRAPGRGGSSARPRDAAPERLGLAVAFMAATVAYVATMGAGILGFRDATFLFLAASGLILARGARGKIVPVLAISATIAVGGYHLFTRFFFIALP